MISMTPYPGYPSGGMRHCDEYAALCDRVRPGTLRTILAAQEANACTAWVRSVMRSARERTALLRDLERLNTEEGRTLSPLASLRLDESLGLLPRDTEWRTFKRRAVYDDNRHLLLPAMVEQVSGRMLKLERLHRDYVSGLRMTAAVMAHHPSGNGRGSVDRAPSSVSATTVRAGRVQRVADSHDGRSASDRSAQRPYSGRTLARDIARNHPVPRSRRSDCRTLTIAPIGRGNPLPWAQGDAGRETFAAEIGAAQDRGAQWVTIADRDTAERRSRRKAATVSRKDAAATRARAIVAASERGTAFQHDYTQG